MTSSDEKYQVRVCFEQWIEGLHLTLVDGTFNQVFSGYSEDLALELPRGIYQLKATFIDYYQEYILIADKDETFRFSFNYPSVAPVLKFITTHEYFSDNSFNYSRTSTFGTGTEPPDFFFFGAKYSRDLFPDVIMEYTMSEYSLYDSNNKLIFTFEPGNTRFDNADGWFAFSTKLCKGQFFLKWSNAEDCRIFPFHIIDGLQTQFFIRYTEKPDFGNCFFFYSDKIPFNVCQEEYVVLEKIMFAFKDYQANYPLLNGKDRSIIGQTPYLATLVMILQQMVARSHPDWVKGFDFTEMPALPLPDLPIITNQELPEESGHMLPVLSCVMTGYAFLNQEKEQDFSPLSLIARTVEHLRYDLFWNNFSKIDEIADLKNIYSEAIRKDRADPEGTLEQVIPRVTKSFLGMLFRKRDRAVLTSKIQSALENINAEDIESLVNDAINKIGDVSMIARKLNLPPTRVLRNYRKYKELYEKLKQNEG